MCKNEGGTEKTATCVRRTSLGEGFFNVFYVTKINSRYVISYVNMNIIQWHAYVRFEDND